MTLYIIIIIFLINFFLFSFNKKISDKINLYDVPDARKLHKNPVSLNGGIFYFINLLIIFVIDIFFNNFYLLGSLGFENEVNSILTLLVIFSLLLLGIIDDKISLKPISKTLVSLIIFFIFLSIKAEYRILDLRFETFNLTVDLFELSLVFTILCFMILQIILNLYDGINLQSSLYYSIILIHLIAINQEHNLFIICVLTLIYLVYFSINNYSSNIFLGDNGIYIFSFILSLLIIKTYQNNNDVFLVEEIFVILFVPTVDAIRLFFTRLIKNKNPLKADRTHLHHILLKKYGLIKANILLILPLISSTLLMNFSKLDIIVIIFMNGISYLYLLKNK
jgi:UDP-GlcNAc:undecaprenyl-phosphate/decaprenyl-phosphate GlcNAc-1-phosphate transferase